MPTELDIEDTVSKKQDNCLWLCGLISLMQGLVVMVVQRCDSKKVYRYIIKMVLNCGKFYERNKY